MKSVIEKVKAENKVVKHKEFDVKQVKQFWSTYSEFEIKFGELRDVMEFCFKFMPSSIEIIYPENISLDSMEFNALLNDILGRQHENDMMIKNAVVQIRALRDHIGIKPGENLDEALKKK